MNDLISAETQAALGTLITTYLQPPTPFRPEFPVTEYQWPEIQERCMREHYCELYLAAKKFVESYEADALKGA